MAEPSGSAVRQGQPRTEKDAAFLERFDSANRIPLIVSAILPLIVAPQSGKWFSLVIGVVTWLVFLVDYVVHVRHLQHYGRTGFGRFDLFVVIATAPWFLLPGAHSGSFVVLLRLARLGPAGHGQPELTPALRSTGSGRCSGRRGAGDRLARRGTSPSTRPIQSSPRSATRSGGAS